MLHNEHPHLFFAGASYRESPNKTGGNSTLDPLYAWRKKSLLHVGSRDCKLLERVVKTGGMSFHHSALLDVVITYLSVRSKGCVK